MRIKRLELENFRGFKKATVDFPEGNVVVFFGWNGAGKTAVLDAVAIVLGDILYKKAFFSSFWLEDDDILVGQQRVQIKTLFDNVAHYPAFQVTGTKKVGKEPEFQKTEQLDFWHEEVEALPVISYYKTNREFSVQDRYLQDKFSNLGRTSAYSTAIEAAINNFNDLVDWLRYEEDIENQQKIEKRDFNWENPSIKTIRRGITKFLSKMDAEYSGLKVKRQSNGEVDFSKPSQKSDLYIQKAGQELKLSQLSSGERSLILLVADIARRATILNPQMSDPLLSEGIVLIDEIELHLHPKWQRAVIPALQATFPNIQFIIATHSPQVLSEVENGGVFEIEDFQIHPRDTYGRDNNWLLHVIMEDDQRPAEVQDSLAEYFTLLRSGQLDEAASLRQQIEEKIGTDDPEFVKADILLRRKERALAS